MPLFLKNQGEGVIKLVDGPVPTAGEHEVLVKVVAVGQNPIDWQCIHDFFTPENVGATVGVDYAGVVSSIGSGVTRYAVGDRIAGFVFGNINVEDQTNGSFAEYLIGDELISFKIPDSVSFEDASSFGCTLTTVALVFQSLKLEPPSAEGESSKKDETILVYGGSSGVGTIFIQYAHLAGYKVVTTASPKNFDLVKSFGADAVFDYHDSEVASKIKEYTGGKLTKALNCICKPGTTDIVAASLNENGGEVHNMQYLDLSEFPKLQQHLTVSYSVFGKAYALKTFQFPVDLAAREYAAKFWVLNEKLYGAGKIKAHPVEVRPNGLAGVEKGFEDQKQWNLSGKKYVYLIADTPGVSA